MAATLSHTYRTFLTALENATVDPGGLATQLYAEGLIDKLAHERAQLHTLATLERSRELLQKLGAKIETDCDAFDKFICILNTDPTMEELCKNLRDMRNEVVPGNTIHSPKYWLASHFWLVIGAFLVLIVALLLSWDVRLDCYQFGTCSSKSLPRVDNFVGREEDIRNITRYLDFEHSDIQVVHIVGPPGFGKSTLAKRIGHIFLQKRVKVHYVDIRAVTDMDGLAERIMLSIIDSPKYKIEFYHLEKWISKQYSNTLLILDNCDEMFEASKEDFLHSIKKLTVLSSVKYLLTSQRWIADIGNFRLHQIYNLSSEAASRLLGKLAPSLTEDQRIQIAELTGNVPLALEVLGAIFNFPNAPTVEEVIKCLKADPVDTLSPNELPEYSTVYMSINLAYSYLSPELKDLCLNLSYFPGSFEMECASCIFDYEYGLYEIIRTFNHKNTQVDTLVRRSLLHVSITYHRRIYYFHQLIRSFFLHRIQDQKMKSLQQNFDSRFQFCFTDMLDYLMEKRGGQDFELAVLDANKHNLQYMFNLFTTSKHLNYTLFSINKTVLAIKINLLQLRFTPTELHNISQNMLIALESYTTDEKASEESFLEIYTQLVIQAAKLEWQSHIEATSSIEILSSRESKIEEGYKRGLVSAITYIQFYADLAQYYEENNEEEKSTQCHMHILEHVHNEKCYPPCDYFSISVAYEKTGESTQAFHFRELAYKHQQSSLSRMQQAKLYLDLYNDYTLRNSPSKVEFFSNEIIETVYLNLIQANENEYSKEVYFNAVDFFRAKNMEQHVVLIQSKMQFVILSKCKNSSCINHLVLSLLDAWKRQCYHLTIQLSLIVLNKGQLTLENRASLSQIIGLSYYYIGSYSESQVWLRRAQQFYIKHPENRQTACLYLLKSGDYFNIICYGYLVKDTMSQLSAQIIELVYCTRTDSQSEKVIETAVTEVKHSYIWMQFFNKFKYIITNQIPSAKWIIIQFHDSCMFSLAIILICMFILCLAIPIISFNSILIIAELMSACCTERQIRCCFSCATFCIFLSIFSNIVMFVFVLGLDVLY